MSRVSLIVEPFAPITLGETIARASLQHRFDAKYLTDDSTAASLLADLADSFQVLEITGRRVFHYRTEYLDSPGRDAFRAHVQGRRRRYKCRVRHYVDSGESQMEIKLKGARGETVKSRAPYGAGQSVGDCAEFLAACVADAYGLEVDHRLQPVLEVAYRRITLVSRSSPERVTLDNGMRFIDLASRRFRSVSDDLWIVETKSATGKGFADERLREAHVRPIDVSKYVLGVALTNPGTRANDYASLIRSLDASVDEQRRTATAA